MSYKNFENLWIQRNVNKLYDCFDSLTDDEYIEFKNWEGVNFKEMYKKHLPNMSVHRGKNDHIIFHGGCLRCKSQIENGIDRCKGCKYFRNTANKYNNLFIEGDVGYKMSQEDIYKILNEE